MPASCSDEISADERFAETAKEAGGIWNAATNMCSLKKM
jgi:hypothetical protein